MDNFKLFQNQKKIPIKESIKNSLRIKEKENINVTISKYTQAKNNSISENRYIDNNIKFSEISNKFLLKSFNKEITLEEFNNNIKTKKSYSLRLKQKNNNKNENKNNSINFKNYNLSLKKRQNFKYIENRYKNENNQIIYINNSNDIKDMNFKKNNLFLSFTHNIKKEKEYYKYYKTLENCSKETINTNNNYINNIINININFDKKRKKYRNQLSLSLKDTINYFTDNLLNNNIHNNSRKNIKLNFNINNKNLNNISSSFKNIKNINKYIDTQYNHTISNEMENNNKTKSKNTFLRLLSSKNRNKKNNYISFGKLMKSDINKRIKNNNNEYNLKMIKNNILFKMKNRNNQKILFLNNINPIINNIKTKKSKKKKNYFIQNKKQNKINKIKNLYSFRDKNNKRINFLNSPKEQGVKIILRKSVPTNYYNNNKPELVKEYNQEILLNLLIDEYIFRKNIKLTLNSELLINYGINPSLRSFLIDSLLGLQDIFKFHNKTWFIAIQIFDNYITTIISQKSLDIKINESDLDLLITACFLIASKSEESFIYHLTDYLSIISDNYTLKDLMTMEYNILKLFNFQAFHPNVLDFFEFFSVFFDLDENLNKKGVLILLIIISDLYLSQMSSSFLSFTVICLLFKNIMNYNDIFNKLNCLFDYLYENNNCNNENEKVNFNKLQMLLKPLKNENMIKQTVEKIFNYIKNFDKDELVNITKKLEKYNNLI